MKYILMLYYFLLFMTASVNAEEVTKCDKEIGKMMEIAGLYMTKEATATRLVKDLRDIVGEKDIEIAELRSIIKKAMDKEARQ